MISNCHHFSSPIFGMLDIKIMIRKYRSCFHILQARFHVFCPLTEIHDLPHFRGLLGEKHSQHMKRLTISIMHNHKSQRNIIFEKGIIEINEKLSCHWFQQHIHFLFYLS